uniref:Uncharacterized protein n=1 Tax=Timema monikensis TaxID=170555 RepID=A0A7R9EH06_9NEOP|nr:unnamed protein product [Timema monikensis]
MSAKRCWEKFKSQVKKQKQLERQHSMKTGGGEPYKTSPADDELAAQVLQLSHGWMKKLQLLGTVMLAI